MTTKSTCTTQPLWLRILALIIVAPFSAIVAVAWLCTVGVFAATMYIGMTIKALGEMAITSHWRPDWK